MNDQTGRTVAKGGAAWGLAYLAATAPTEWLGLLPNLPHDKADLMVGALTVTIAAFFEGIRRFLKAKESNDV